MIIGGNGEEKIRYCGAPETPKAFIEHFTKLIPQETSWEAYDKKLKENPSFITKYQQILKDAYLVEKADQLRYQMFLDSSMEERFNKKNIAYYSQFIWDFNNRILRFMMENVSEVEKVMGEGKCRDFLHAKCNSLYFKVNRVDNIEEYDNALKLGDENPILQSAFYWLLKENRDDILNGKLYKPLKAAYNTAKLGDPHLNYYVYTIIVKVGNLRAKDVELSNKERKLLLKYLTAILESETHPKRKEWFVGMIEKFDRK